MSLRQRRTVKRRVTDTPATIQDLPDNCAARHPHGCLPNQHGKLDGSLASTPPPLIALKITYKDPAQLKPRPGNPRTHDTQQVKRIASSIREFGFVNPVLIDAMNGIVA